MPAIVTSDLHLTTAQDDEHRWGIFQWLRSKRDKHGVRAVFILGDLTDAKNKHDAVLVNRVVHELTRTAKGSCTVYVLKGNHDYIDGSTPYFDFLNELDYVRFVSSPEKVFIPELGKFLLLPHTRTAEEDWKALDFDTPDYILMHQTVKGARFSNGVYAPDGIASAVLNRMSNTRVISGDVHVPQKVKNVEYVGSPYHVHFGDKFKPRAMLINDDGTITNLRFNTVRKFVLTVDTPLALQTAGLKPNDQIKVQLQLPRSEYHAWHELKDEVAKAATRLKVKLRGVELLTEDEDRVSLNVARQLMQAKDNKQSIKRFADNLELSDETLQMGMTILEEIENAA